MNRLAPALAAAALAGSLIAPAAAAEWALDPERSQVAFVSIKSDDIGEAHHFEEISGQVDDDGQATVDIKLASVETLIPIRNERMREMLFNTTEYNDATLSAKIDQSKIAAMRPGDIIRLAAESTLELHGNSQALVLDMQVAKVAPSTLMVASTKPVILDAKNFGLGDGVDKLREIAGLERISDAVPVTFVLTFEEQQPANAETGTVSADTIARYQEYRAIIEAMSSAQKEAVAALFGSAQR
jgi:polyisoprenoid-binding protein YceI